MLIIDNKVNYWAIVITQFMASYVYNNFTSLWLLQMGNCVGRDQPNKTNIRKKDRIGLILSSEEISILQLIFKDLSERIKQRKINHENFLLFFHKNGYWGSRLFKEFDYDETKLISQEEFIVGIAKIFKSAQIEKINLLFKFFSQRNGQTSEGVCFEQFLIMLYNYPKEDLKEILDDKDFFEVQLKKMLVMVQTKKKDQSKVYRLQSGFKNHREDSERSLETPISSLIGKEICKNIEEKYHRKGSTTVKFHDGDQIIHVRTTTIQRLVKRFAVRIFKESKIDIRCGKLSFQQFHQWISVHKRLYENYYEGFHNQIWQVDSVTKKPQYLSVKCEKVSEGKVVLSGKTFSASLFLHHSILVVCEEGKLEMPVLVICLEGLIVKRIYESENGFGFSITHRDDFYHEKKVFLKNEGLLLEWMELLRFYNGESIQQKYEVEEKIGTGKFSVVYRCKRSADQREYALKEIATYKLDNESKRLIAHESSIMKVVSHPLLLEFKECIQTKNHIYIITELVKGRDLFDFVKEYKYLDEYHAAQIAVQLIVGIRFLHSFEIVHRDLKPENIMVVFDESSQQIQYIKIIDFGFSNYISKLQTKNPEELLTGTPNYIAPQILKEEGISLKIDNFAIGSILYFMLTGNLAFNDTTVTGILLKTIKGDYRFGDKVALSKLSINLIDQLLKIDPKERISLEDALKHPWFQILKQSLYARPSIDD